MKRSAAWLLVLALFVSACSGGTAETADPDTAAPEAPTTTTVAPTTTQAPTTTVATTTTATPTTTVATTTTATPTTTVALPTVGGRWFPPETMQGCGGFLSQQEAQGWFDYYFDDLGDISELDTNGDGIPCHNAEDLFCCAWEVHSEGYTPTTDPHPAPITGSEYRDPSRPSMDTDLCRLADHRGLTRYVYEEPMVEGVDYTNRLTDADRNIAYLSPMFATGFPLDPNMNPSIGTLEVAFLAIDFPDSPGSETQLAKARTVANEVTEYFRIASGGRLQTNFRFGDRVFRVPKDSGTFGLQGSGGLGRDLTVEVVEAADPYIDFTGVHSLFMLIPETNTQIANDWHVSPTPKNDGSNPFAVITEEGAIRAWVGNGYVFFRPDMIELGGLAMFYVHESLHDLGLVDLYLYGYQAADDLFDPGPTNVPMGEWAVMSAEHGHTRELIAWHRWLLEWLGDEQVYCRPSDSLTDVELSLSPLTREEEGYKAAMIPVSDRKVIVVESRRAEGYSASAGGMAIAVDVDGIRKRAYLRDFGADGLLVYTYDTSVIDGVGPARIQIPEGRPSEWDWVRCPITECTWANRGDLWTNWDPDNPDNVLLETQLDPLLRIGDSITVEGVTIELIEWGESDRVRISK